MAFGVQLRHRLGSRCLEAPVAQLDRALPSEGRGQGFESLRVRHTNILILFVNCRLLRCEIPAKICRGNTWVTPIRNSKCFFATIHPGKSAGQAFFDSSDIANECVKIHRFALRLS